jgi:hypothetical protein
MEASAFDELSKHAEGASISRPPVLERPFALAARDPELLEALELVGFEPDALGVNDLDLGQRPLAKRLEGRFVGFAKTGSETSPASVGSMGRPASSSAVLRTRTSHWRTPDPRSKPALGL